MLYPIADLHCDLLCYLAGEAGRTAYDACVRCSIPQLQQGPVKLQVMPIFTETCAHSTLRGNAQAERFKALPVNYPDVFGCAIDTRLAIENGSSFAEEDEPLSLALARLSHFGGPPVYISFTWNTENRFGGGAHTKIGLKSDGKVLLDYLNQQKIAVDLSHASDELAYDILDYIDNRGLNIPIIASHSNFRAVTNVSRNLPDDLVREIMQRDGVIGFNFVRLFVGPESPLNFVRQLEHLLTLGGGKLLCFGADFFYHGDVSPQFRKTPEEYFFPDYGDASAYEKVLGLWRKHLNLSEEIIHDIAYRNLDRFLHQLE